MQQDDGAAGERAVPARPSGCGSVRGRPLGDVRVLIVDHHDVIRTGLASLLHGRAGISVVAQASQARTGARLAGALRPDVVLTELCVPDLPGPQAIRAILARHPDARIIALTLAATDTDMLAALAAGACGHLGKDAPLPEIAAAVRAAARRVPWLSPRAAQAILSSAHEPDPHTARSSSEASRLSPREREVLRLIAGGLSSAELAQALQISPRTAHDHIARILANSMPSPRRPATPAATSSLKAREARCVNDLAWPSARSVGSCWLTWTTAPGRRRPQARADC